ncbi:protogenin-like [Mytilus trossulus]|uniref:protogenin-like n=1 Tax=Mytilus trossulus TaxID=6551 RepID=UPI003007D742
MATHCLYIVGILYVVFWITPANGNNGNNEPLVSGLVVNSQDGHHVVAQKNGKLLLNCSVEVKSSEYGVPNITWRKDGVLIDFDNRIQKVQNGSLYFKRVWHKKKKNISDEGMYECLVQNKIGSIIARRVTLEVASIAKEYSSEPVDKIVDEGGVARFECKIKAVPPPLYTWIKDEVQLATNDRYIIINSGILQILHVNADDAGQYSCHATSGGLHHLPDTVNSITWKRSSEAYLTVKSGNKPRPAKIVAGPSDTVAQSGQTVVLECLVDGSPRPIVKWRREDGKNITKAVLQGTNLKLLELEEKDTGSYICEVSSQNGPLITAKANLVVTTPPVIIEKPKNQKFPRSRVIIFTCDAEGSPKPKITWYKDGQRTLISNTHGRYKIKDEGRQLVIEQTVVEDSGYYQCIAENSVDFVSAFARLLIEKDDTAPGKPNVSAEAVSSRSIKVSWYRPANKKCPILAYSVTMKVADTGSNVETQVMLATDTMKMFTDLVPYTNYTVFVLAYTSKCGAGEQSDPVTVATLEDVPCKAPLIRLVSTTPNTITVKWDPLPLRFRNGVIVEYSIYYMKVESKIIMKERTSGTATSFLITGLDPDTDYRVRVLASTKAGYCRIENKDWPWVDYRTSTGNNPVPTIQVNQINSTSVNVTWQHSSEELPTTGYLLSLNKISSTEPPEEFNLPAYRRNYILTDLENNTFYVVTLVAKNQHGTSGPVVDEFETGYSTVQPPIDVKINTTMETRVTLTWIQPDAGSDVAFYTVRYYHTNPDRDEKRITVTRTTVTIDKLHPFTSYQFDVRAHTRDGKSSPYSKPVFTRTKEDVPSPPVNMSALMKNGNIVVTWKPPVIPNGQITTYVIKYQLGSDEEPQGDWYTIKVNGTITSWSLQYSEGIYYYLKMLACTGAGPGNTTITIVIPEKETVVSPSGSPKDQKIGIIIGCLIGIVCIIICILIILCRNRCFKNSYPQTQTTCYHGNGHIPNHGNGHVTGPAEQSLLDHHQMELFTPILTENQNCDSKGCGSGNLIVTPNGTRINGYVPFKNGMRNGHVPNGHVTAFPGRGEIANPEETRGLIASMLASSDGSHTSEDSSKGPKTSSLDDKSHVGQDLPQNLDILQNGEEHTSPVEEDVQKGNNSSRSCLPPSSLRISAPNQQSTSGPPSCHDSPSPVETEGSVSSVEDCSDVGSNHHTSLNEDKPQSNTSDSLIPSLRNGRIRAPEEVVLPYTYQPPPPPYPGKKRCYANTSPQEHRVNSQQVIDA